MADTPRRKLPIFIRRQIPKEIPSRLSIEEIEAVAKAAAEPTPETKPKPAPPEPSPSAQPVAKVSSKAAAKVAKQVIPPEPVSMLDTTPSPEPETETGTETKPDAIDVIPDAKPVVTAEPVPTPAVEPSPPVPKAPKPPKKPRRHLNLKVKLPLHRLSSLFTRPTLDTWLLLLCLVALVATQLTLIWYARTGLVLNMAALVILVAVGLFRESLRKVAISLAIIPVAQMVSSTIVTHDAFQTAAVLYSVLLVLALTYRYLFTLDEPVAASKLRWMGHFYGLPLMLVIGQALGLLGYAVLRHHYDFVHISLPLVVAAAIIFAFAEEMLLRGLIQQQAARATNPVIAIIVSSSLYVVLTITHDTPLSIIPAIATGVVLSLVYHFKHNLVLTTAVNAASKLAYVGLVATFILR